MEKQIIDRNSMKYWFPKVKDLGIPVPKTILLDVPVKDEEILEAAQEFQFPIFVRTYHAAAKHEWKETCYVKKRKRLIQQVKQMSMVNWHLPDDGIALREFLPLNYQFKAFNEMPVAKERRYFIKDGGIQCHHPYWPEESIQFYSIEKPERWREQLAVLNTETDDEKVQLERMAKKVAQVVDGYWSVDFAQRNNGVWYLIDMAKGEDSFHWLDCPHCPKEQQERYGHSGKKEQDMLSELDKTESFVAQLRRYRQGRLTEKENTEIIWQSIHQEMIKNNDEYYKYMKKRLLETGKFIKKKEVEDERK